MSDLVLQPTNPQTRGPRGLADIADFPGWEKVGGFIAAHIAKTGARVIGDVGGGRLPRVDTEFIARQGLDYHLFDISAEELARADNAYHKVCMDIADEGDAVKRLGLTSRFDLIFSHMLLEHVLDPMQAHHNIFRMLRPGGYAIHMFPSRNNFPLFVNGLVPESVSYWLLKRLQPHRDTDHEEGKFEAYYRYCGAPSAELAARYEALGYEVVQHTGFVGHHYYARIKPIAMIERALRPLIIKTGLPFITANLLILRKPV